MVPKLLIALALPALAFAQTAEVITKCKEANTVAITFDDGPYVYNPDIVDILAAANVTATFFFNGNNWDCIYSEDGMGRVKDAYSRGHQIASHTWSHPDLKTLTSAKVDEEMARVDLALQRIIGVTPAFMRPPFGNYNDAVRRVAAARGQKLVIWDFDSEDSIGASVATSKSLYDQAIAKKPPTILTLNHETIETTVRDVLPYAIQQLKAAGYKLVTVAECLNLPPYQAVTQPQVPDPTWVC